MQSFLSAEFLSPHGLFQVVGWQVGADPETTAAGDDLLP